MTSNNSCLSVENIRMPSEPCPLPSLGSDEESFVVLWKDDDNKSFIEENDEPIGDSVVQEAKELINKELSQLQQLSLAPKNQTNFQTGDLSHQSQDNSSLETNISDQNQSVSTVLPKLEHRVVLPNMEQSTVLPDMPQIQKRFDNSDIISISSVCTDLSSAEIQTKISQIIDENVRLKETILQNNMSMKSQYERIVVWQKEVQKVQEAHTEKIIEAKNFIERLKKENYNLTHDIEQLRVTKNLQDEELANLKSILKDKERKANENLIKSSDDNMKEFELDISNKKVKELELTLQNMILENTKLKEEKKLIMIDASKLDSYENKIEMLQEELNASRFQLEKVRAELMQVKLLDDEKQKSMNEVIESLRSQLYHQQHAMTPSREELANMSQQLRSTQVTLTQVEHSRAAAYAQLAALNNEISELKKQLNGSLSQEDEIYALQTQLEVYKADFEAEKSAKETLRSENEKYSMDMQNLHRRNQQLQEEIDLIRERDYVVYPPHRREKQSSTSSASSEHSMKCPKCSFGFKTLQALENHVYRCIDIDEHLP